MPESPTSGFPAKLPPRVVIEGVYPEIDDGQFPIKRILGERVVVTADIFTDGHDAVSAVLLFRRSGDSSWLETVMTPEVNDHWHGSFTVLELGQYEYTLQAWVDHFGSWRSCFIKKVEAGQDISVDILIGARLVEEAAGRAADDAAKELAEYAASMQMKGKSGMHLLTMINQILDLSKIDAGKMELQLESVSLGDIVNSVVTSTAGLVREKPVEVVQKIPVDLPRLMVDETRISQVLINLISNAVKFTEKGTITIEASISENPFGRREVLVTVADSGMGIAPEDQGKLFQRFSQVDDSPTRKTGGTGLGLSIVKHIVQAHGGKIHHDALARGIGQHEPGGKHDAGTGARKPGIHVRIGLHDFVVSQIVATRDVE